jgi:integrase
MVLKRCEDMPKRAKGLTAPGIKTAGPGMHADGNGLYLSVTARGVKAWIYRYQKAGKRHEMTLSPLDRLSLSDARKKALQLRWAIAEGADPMGDRKTKQRESAKAMEAARKTFRECALAYFAAHRSEWRSEKHASQWTQSMEDHVYPLLGDEPVAAIDIDGVMSVLSPIWTTKAVTARRVRGRVESVLDWARTAGYRPKGELNPATWRGNLSNLLARKAPKAKPHRAMPYIEVPAFMVELRKRQRSSMSAIVLEFAILAAGRTDEALSARWEEIDLEAATWSIPGDRMKGDRPHRVPLTEASVKLLGALTRTSELVFPGRDNASKPMNERLLWNLLCGRMKYPYSPHGFRASFKTWGSEKGYPAELIERCLAHLIGNETERRYERSDLLEQRRPILADWAAHCSTP